MILKMLVFALCVALAQPQEPASVETPQKTDLEIQLEALSPSQPSRYLSLAEDLLASNEPTPGELRLATQLLTRTTVLTLDNDPSTAASACLALTDSKLGFSDDDKAWLRAVASSINPTLARPGWLADPDSDSAPADQASPTAAAALARLRNGDPRRAALLLNEPGVLEALTRSPELALVRGRQSVAEFFDSHADDWPCPTCRGDRFESVRQGTSTTHVLCPHCSGDPGPRYPTSMLIVLLRAELALTGSGGGAWSSAIAASRGVPFRAPNPSELPARLGVRVDSMHWRDGAWVSDPGGG